MRVGTEGDVIRLGWESEVDKVGEAAVEEGFESEDGSTGEEFFRGGEAFLGDVLLGRGEDTFLVGWWGTSRVGDVGGGDSGCEIWSRGTRGGVLLVLVSLVLLEGGEVGGDRVDLGDAFGEDCGEAEGEEWDEDDEDRGE